ncbi:cyclic nucleotide-binding domain-containing protein [Candidatus Riflebacteria bacterium]
MNKNNEKHISLSRGGVLIRTKNYPIQMGTPPESIKDTMLSDCGVPQYFFTARNLYDHQKRQTFVEYEFPIYYNSFVKKRKTIIYCTEEQAKILEKMLRLGIFGPQDLDLSDDYPEDMEVLDLTRELEYFTIVPDLPQQRATFESMCEIRIFVPGEVVKLPDNVKINVVGENVIFEQDDEILTEIAYDHNPKSIPGKDELVRDPFEPLNFGITTLGRGHGFDPDEITAGFILWVNRQAILIDPPVSAGDFMNDLGISKKLIRGIILTHCHSDHDSGVLHSLMLESKVDLITTKTVFNIFVKKYSSLVGMTEEEFRGLVNFNQIRVHEPKVINGAHFIFRYTLHSVPALGFEAFYRGKSINYSGDTLNCPKTIEKIYTQGFISKNRKEELLHFEWKHDAILHECGIPPLHTPATALKDLSAKIKRHLYLYHLSFKNLPPEYGLKPTPGYKEPSIKLDIERHPYEEVQDILDVASRVTLFRDFNWAKAVEFLTIAQKKEVKAHERFIKNKEVGNEFYIIASGKALVSQNGKKIKTYSKCDYIGETSLILDTVRNADVIALTPMTLLYINKEEFLEFIRDTHVEENCRRLALVREKGVWECLEKNWLFSEMTITQKTHLAAMMYFSDFKPGQVFLDYEDELNDLFLLNKGRVSMEILEVGEPYIRKELNTGDLVSDFGEFQRIGKQRLRLTATENAEVFLIPGPHFRQFLKLNTGLMVLIKTRIAAHNSLFISDNY